MGKAGIFRNGLKTVRKRQDRSFRISHIGIFSVGRICQPDLLIFLASFDFFVQNLKVNMESMGKLVLKTFKGQWLSMGSIRFIISIITKEKIRK